MTLTGPTARARRSESSHALPSHVLVVSVVGDDGEIECVPRSSPLFVYYCPQFDLTHLQRQNTKNRKLLDND